MLNWRPLFAYIDIDITYHNNTFWRIRYVDNVVLFCDYIQVKYKPLSVLVETSEIPSNHGSPYVYISEEMSTSCLISDQHVVFGSDL